MIALLFKSLFGTKPVIGCWRFYVENKSEHPSSNPSQSELQETLGRDQKFTKRQWHLSQAAR